MNKKYYVANDIVTGWDLTLTLKWKDGRRKLTTVTAQDIPDWLAKEIDDYITGIEDGDYDVQDQR